MGKVVRRAVAATLASIIVSVVIGMLVLPLAGGAFDTTAMLMCVACPLAIAFPVAFHTENQKHKLSLVNANLLAAHAELARAHALLAQKATIDDMTGMLNRATFLTRLGVIRETTLSGSLLMIDADKFKTINDEHGHAVGDTALQAIAAAIRRALREGDLVGRIGGEEFCAFLPDTEPGAADAIAERIRAEVEQAEALTAEGRRLALTVSIGCTRHRPGARVVELMREAVRRLYRAKDLGRNRVVSQDGRIAA